MRNWKGDEDSDERFNLAIKYVLSPFLFTRLLSLTKKKLLYRQTIESTSRPFYC